MKLARTDCRALQEPIMIARWFPKIRSQQNMTTRLTSTPSRKASVLGANRLQKYVGKSLVSFYYRYPNGSSEKVSSAPIGDRKAIAEAERIARRKAMDIQEG